MISGRIMRAESVSSKEKILKEAFQRRRKGFTSQNNLVLLKRDNSGPHLLKGPKLISPSRATSRRSVARPVIRLPSSSSCEFHPQGGTRALFIKGGGRFYRKRMKYIPKDGNLLTSKRKSFDLKKIPLKDAEECGVRKWREGSFVE